MDTQDSKLWLKIDKIHKLLAHLKWSYAGTEDKEIIEDMIKYIMVLKNKIEKKD